MKPHPKARRRALMEEVYEIQEYARANGFHKMTQGQIATVLGVSKYQIAKAMSEDFWRRWLTFPYGERK